MSDKENSSVPVNQERKGVPISGRVDWVEPTGGKTKDGVAYYYTCIVTPSSDPYLPPSRCAVTSEGQFAKPGQDVDILCRTQLNSKKNVRCVDKATGEEFFKDFHHNTLWLVR